MIIDVHKYVLNRCKTKAPEIWKKGIGLSIFIVQLSGRSFIKIEVP